MATRHSFQEKWLSSDIFKSWLAKVEGDKKRAYCRVCHKYLTAEITCLKRHCKSRQHTSLEERLQSTARSNAQSSQPGTSQNDQDNFHIEDHDYHAPSTAAATSGVSNGVAYATILLSVFLAEHNLPFMICDHLIDLNKRMFPDSNIAAEMSMKRTKCTFIVNKLGKFSTECLSEKLKKCKFSIIVDESTDCSDTKSLAIMVKYFDEEESAIKLSMLDIVNVHSDGNGSTGQGLFNIIKQCLVVNNIPLDNLTGFASDGASNMMGTNNSVTSRLREECAGITIFRCVSHSIHLCASEAAKTLPRACEELLRNIYNYFAHSGKRKYEFREFQDFCKLKPHKILHASATRWLSLHEAVARVLEQWNALKLYFHSKVFDDRLLAVENIRVSLEDQAIVCYLHFLNYILPHINNFNLVFQNKGPSLHLLHDKICSLYRFLIHSFCQEHLLSKVALYDIDPANASLHKPVHQIYLGAKLHSLFQTPKYANNVDMITHIRLRCMTFLIRLCQEIKKRFDFNNKLWMLTRYLHPRQVMDPTARSIMPSLSDLMDELPRISNIFDKQTVDNEWRNVQFYKFPDHLKDLKHDICKFYAHLMTIKDDMGHFQYRTLATFALNVLSLPTSNADVERLFSKLNLIKRKQRNCLHMNTVKSLMVLSEISLQQGDCRTFEPSPNMLLCLTN